MMTRYGICPDCGSHIPEHRHDETWVLCECGWMGSHNTSKQESQLQKAAATRIILTGLLLLMTFLHTAKWGQESLRVIPLQAQTLLEVASPEVMHKYALTCLKRSMHTDAEHYMSKWAEKVNTPEAWKELAFLRKQMKLPHPAIVAFENYTKLEGREPLALFHYAQTLEEVEKVDKAESIYRYIVRMDKEVYQRTVVEELVRLLVAKNKLQEANIVLHQLSKPNMELPSHLVRQKEWIKQLLTEQNKTSSSASL